MILVSINGIIQCPGVDYHSTSKSISFSTPPQAGSTISIQSKKGVWANIYGDGSTYLFEFFGDLESSTSFLIEEAVRLRNVPAVADMLERLEVVVKLAKQE